MPRKKSFRVPDIRHGLSPKAVDLKPTHELAALFAAHGHGVEVRGHHRLYVHEIIMAEEVFQPRFTATSTERHGFLRHVESLRAQLRSDPEVRSKGFDAVVVFPIAGTWYCLEGHARLYAYKAEGWSERRVKVEVFAGTFTEALQESVSRNSEIKLPMSNAERCEAAWRLVLAGVPSSNRELARACRVSHPTIGRMLRVARYGIPRLPCQHLQSGTGEFAGYARKDLIYTAEEARRMSWHAVLLTMHAGEQLPDGDINYLMLDKNKLVTTLHRHFPKAGERPELFASALAKAFPDIRKLLALHLSRETIAEHGESVEVFAGDSEGEDI